VRSSPPEHPPPAAHHPHSESSDQNQKKFYKICVLRTPWVLWVALIQSILHQLLIAVAITLTQRVLSPELQLLVRTK
jgi:hypothetical protein